MNLCAMVKNGARTMASIRYIVTDIDRSVEFYRDKLGFSVDMHNPSKFAALLRDDLTLYLSAPGVGSGGTAGGTPEPGGWNRFRYSGAWWMEPLHDYYERHRRSHRPIE